jgi:spermidine synthase
LTTRPAVLFALFFGSGACALAYQVLWLRLLSLVFGVTVYAGSTVLAAFMSGLALGGLLSAPLLRRVPRPLRVFGAAEILVGLSALATPFELEAAAGVYRWLHAVASDHFGVLTAARFATSFLVLLLPTVLMGLTLPVVSASRLVRDARFGARLGALYAANTLGAMAGALLTGFVLIGAIGIQRSFLLAAALNVTIGVVAWAMDREGAGDPAAPASDAPPGVEATGPSLALVAMVVAASGLAALALEVVWFRMLVLFLDATTYAFTTMLATVLAGIAAGGAVAARLLRRDRDLTSWLAGLLYATGLAVVGSAALLSWSYAAGGRTSAPFAASAAAIFPATVLMGVAFPIALRAGVGAADVRDPAATARRVGRLCALNLGAAVAGAVLGGFVLLPRLGTRGSLIGAAALYVAAATLIGLVQGRRGALLAAAGVGAFAVVAGQVPDPFAAALGRRHGAEMRELWRHDGVQAAVSVSASPQQRVLLLDGIHQADDSPELVRLHRAIGHLALLLHPAPRDVLVVGLGGGATAGAVSRHPGVHVQVVELSEGVRLAAPYFAHVSHDVLRQPGVELRVDDGRSFLALSGERFDVVTADIIRPQHAGAGLLYSREYFTLVRRALREDGIALQWIGHRSPTQYRLLMRTFLDVFPEATLWHDGELMAGSLRPLRLSRSNFEARRAHAETRAALDEVGLTSFESLLGWYTGGPREMKVFVGEGPVLTDDRPLLEYFRSLPRRQPAADLTSLRGDVSALVVPQP